MISTNFFTTHGFGIRRHDADAGDVIPEHAHEFPHLTEVVTALCRVSLTHPDGRHESADLGPGEFCDVPAEALHRIEWLLPGRVHCIYAHRDAQGQIVQYFTGFLTAYAATDPGHAVRGDRG